MAASEFTGLQELLQLDFDPQALKDRYDLERDKRLRAEGAKQYIKMEGEYQKYLDDTFHQDRHDRDPVVADVDVVIIGGGFAGLQTAAQLRKVGVDNFRIIERAHDYGGTWLYNQYPGAACDSEAYCYLPLLEDTGYIPSQRYTDAEEIQQHAQRIGHRFNLHAQTLFQTSVNSATWNEDGRRWTIETDRGDTLRARFVVLAAGESFTSGKLPGIPGINRFKGDSFHSARWDYQVTGGNTHGDLYKLREKRVAVIGTGASAVQIIPVVARYAKHLYVFQRTPALVASRQSFPTDPEWAAGLEPGWQERRAWNMMANVEGNPSAEPLYTNGVVSDSASLSITLRNLGAEVAEMAGKAGVELTLKQRLALANMTFMEKLRARIDDTVDDPNVAESLKPYFASWCKRPTFSDDYYPTFNRSNVTLVSCPAGVDEITEHGLVVDGVEYGADLIVYASGLAATNPELFQVAQFPITGRNGVTLQERWRDEFRNLHGMLVSGLPNYFQMTLVGNGLGANYLYGNGKQAMHIAWIVNHCLEGEVASVEATVEAEEAWLIAMRESWSTRRIAAARMNIGECTPSYVNNEGNPDDAKAVLNNFYGGGIIKYAKILEEWRNHEILEGYAKTSLEE
ncbi:flavin-containing monooxygenase [Actinacidiphila sp. bgisy144]|uniref:flavin-containing monooxygenase n=1 Tax=Actinacidiphila sp. bgisy144 TaxID=3413791 RepID=UPI003EC0D8DB